MFFMFRMLTILTSQTMGIFYFGTFQSLRLTNIVFTIKLNQGTRLATDSLFLGNENFRILRRCFKELSFVLSGNEVGVGINSTFVTAFAMVLLATNLLKAL